MDPRREQRELAAGAHIVVGTPGRLCDHLRRGRLDISELKAVVLDEADEMLDLGFREDMEFILKTTPDTRRTLLFSATLPRGIVALAQAVSAARRSASRSPATKAVMPISSTAPSGSRPAMSSTRSSTCCASMSRRARWCSATRAMRPASAGGAAGARLLRGRAVGRIDARTSATTALQSLRDGRARVCVATDVAARGIDLPNLDLVIHADLPNDRRGHAASLRPHRPRRPQGRQRPAGAAGAPAARGNAAESSRASTRSGARRRRRKKSASSIRSA